MPRESPGYRDQLESIIAAFPKGEYLTAAGLRLLYHLPSLYATRKFPSKTRVFS